MLVVFWSFRVHVIDDFVYLWPCVLVQLLLYILHIMNTYFISEPLTQDGEMEASRIFFKRVLFYNSLNHSPEVQQTAEFEKVSTVEALE